MCDGYSLQVVLTEIALSGEKPPIVVLISWLLHGCLSIFEDVLVSIRNLFIPINKLAVKLEIVMTF
jgi:hypothetical protein